MSGHHDEREENLSRILQSPSYRVAYKDVDFLDGPKLRPMRMELELLKPELAFEERGIRSTIVIFGSTRIVEPAEARHLLQEARDQLAQTPDDARRKRAVARAERLLASSRYYEIAREFARLVAQCCRANGGGEYVVCTGGGPGIMEAANRGTYDAGVESIGLNIRLPREQLPNPFITPELCFQFHYFAIRKFHFLLRARALVVFPGGFGTIDELFDALTLRQTQRMQRIPIVLFGREFWQEAVDFQFMADEGTIDDADLDLFRFAETAQEAWQMIQEFQPERPMDDEQWTLNNDQ